MTTLSDMSEEIMVVDMNQIISFWVEHYELKQGRITNHEYFVDANKGKVAIILKIRDKK